MRRNLFFLVPSVLILTLGLTQTVLATPDAPRAAINPATLECMPIVYWRDECRELILPSGWEYSAESTCPAGYIEIPDFELEILMYKNPFCCQQRGEEYCLVTETPQRSQATLIIETKTPTAAPELVERSTGSKALPIAGGLSLLAGLGLGVYQFLARKKS